MRLSWIFGVGGVLTFFGFVLAPGLGAFLLGAGLAVLLSGGVVSADRSMSRGRETSHGARPHRPYLGVAVLFWAVPAVLLLFGYLTAPGHNLSGCEGIGFGCTPTPKDSFALAALFVYPSLVVAGLLVTGVIALVGAWRQRSRKINWNSLADVVTVQSI